MSRIVTISAAQISRSEFAIEGNVAKICDCIRRASGSDIICFPEGSLAGGTPVHYDEVKEHIKTIGTAAKQANIWALFNSCTVREGPISHKTRIFNESYLLNRTGELVYTYKKVHLFDLEKLIITPGNYNHVVTTDFGKIGITICWDIAFGEGIRALAREGVQIVFCSANWGDMRLPNKLDYWGYPNARAHENQIYFVFCDASPVGTAGIGRSRILSPVRTRAEAKEVEEVITAKVDLDRLKTMRERYDCSAWQERQPIGAKLIRDAGTLIRKAKFL